jgi:protein-S-isoprenylcysteine O-methyltransferase Ste14
MRNISIKEIIWVSFLTIICILCFPINPLVLTGLLEPGFYFPLYILSWIAWAFGMVLIMAPIIMFPRRGGVPEGKSFVYTTRLVDSGIYAIIRHPQYTGGIYAIFITNLLANPHWLFAVLGFLGSISIVISCSEEDKRLVERFGDQYIAYMKRVPGMNFLVGIIRFISAKSKQDKT